MIWFCPRVPSARKAIITFIYSKYDALRSMKQGSWIMHHWSNLNWNRYIKTLRISKKITTIVTYCYNSLEEFYTLFLRTLISYHIYCVFIFIFIHTTPGTPFVIIWFLKTSVNFLPFRFCNQFGYNKSVPRSLLKSETKFLYKIFTWGSHYKALVTEMRHRQVT